MNNNIFSGLEKLGFEDIEDIKIYKDTDDEEKDDKKSSINSPLYNKSVICPVCGYAFKAKSVKSSHYRIGKRDSDFFIRYLTINPYFYDVWLCNSCGYAALKVDFENLKEPEIKKIEKVIKSRWKSREYPENYDENIAIERYKLALLNYAVIDSKSSKKALTCLKLAWMYRLLKDEENEITFLRQALEGFNNTFFNEFFPVYGMNKFIVMYLIGELHRRIGEYDNALLWYSQVITTPGVSQKLKELARDGKDLIKEEQEAEQSHEAVEETAADIEEDSKKGIFSRLFSK
ncbi:DUF2225 domain-containing protein [uncultured Clostridium sp.]|uniref:DUF2225 domain-containing protein n=1 Tax=uncultured Clostridium sp. TaxID=59620 RepID=UPI0028E52528|nr:DUF2225 domain-containing protein [uncultured Clostridium sp.]